MLFEPGPLSLFTGAEIPTQTSWQWLRYAAVEPGQALAGAELELGVQGSILASAGVNELELGPVQELAAAANEHDAQRREHDGSIGGVASSADALAGELSGNAGEVLRDINAGLPPDPVIPPDPYSRGGVPPEAPSSEWDAIVMQQVRLITGTVPTTAQLVYARRFRPDVAALKAWIFAGMPMEEAPPPPPEEPPPGPDWPAWDAGVNSLFRELGGRDAFDGEINFARRFYAESRPRPRVDPRRHTDGLGVLMPEDLTPKIVSVNDNAEFQPGGTARQRPSSAT